jgi:outer membrane protein TolC
MLAAYDHRDPDLNLSYRGRYSYTEQLKWKYNYGVTLPSELSSTQTVDNQVNVMDSYAAALSIYPQNPFERHHKISGAGADNRAAVADVRLTEWEVSTDVRRLFAQLDCLQKEVIVLDQLVAVQEDMLRVIRSQVNQGQLTAQEMIKISQNYLAALSDANRTARQRDQTRALLGAYLNLPTSEVNIVVDEKTFPDPDIESMNADELVQQAMLDRSDLAELHWKTRAAYEAWQQADAAKVPWLSKMQAVYTSYNGEQRTDLGSAFRD